MLTSSPEEECRHLEEDAAEGAISHSGGGLVEVKQYGPPRYEVITNGVFLRQEDKVSPTQRLQQGVQDCRDTLRKISESI